MRTQHLSLTTLLLTVVLLGLPISFSPGEAAAPPPPGEETLFELADYVIEGQVEGVTSAWAEGHTTIHTQVDVTVSSHLKGDLPRQVTVKHLGGEVDGVGLTVSTEARFAIGEEVRLYLVLREDGTLWVLWGSEGKISLSEPTIEPQYVYDGQHWSDGDIPVPYYINEEGSSGIPDDSEFTAVQAAFQTWNDVSCSYMEFTYAGTTWRAPSTYGQYDDHNVVGWMAKEDWGGSPSPTALAVNQWWYSGDLLLEFDITLFEGWPWWTDTVPGSFDVQSVVTHEAGHALSLLHSSFPGAVMYPSIAAGQIKRTLSQDDVNGICAIYPRHFDVAPTELVFLQDLGSGNMTPPSRDVSIEGDRPWNSAADRPWIGYAPTLGEAPSTMTISMTGTGGFETGVYTGTVTITDTVESEPYAISIRLSVADVQTTHLPLVLCSGP